MRAKCFLAAGLLLAAAACEQRPETQRFAGLAQGTIYQVTYLPGPGSPSPATVQDDIEAMFQRIDKLMSNYRDDSVIAQFNRDSGGRPVRVGEEIVTLVQKAAEVTAAGDGCFDLTVQPLGDLWGFGGDNPRAPAGDQLAAALRHVGMDLVTVHDRAHLRKLDPRAQVDLSAIAQGYSAGLMAGIVEGHGSRNYIVEIGGEMVVRGRRPEGGPWRIGIRNPEDTTRVWRHSISIAAGAPVAIATSGTYEHFFSQDGQRYSHIIDGRDGRPVTHDTVSVTVQHSDPALADAWSTALLCLGQDDGLVLADRHGLAALFISGRGEALQQATSRAWRDAIME